MRVRTCVFLCERAVCVSFVNARAHVCMYLCVCVWGGGRTLAPQTPETAAHGGY